MKKNRLTALMLIASLAANGFGALNVCSAETVTGENEAFDINSLGVRGDMNNDGKLSIFDLIRYRMYLLGSDIELPSAYQTDINGDGKNNISDFIMLKSALLDDIKIWSPKNMPVMDGSTSAIPLEAGFKAKMLGINYSDAKSLVSHHKTHEAFARLLSGENDMIFTVPISESQQKDADKAGVHLNHTPVAKESFVFVVNKNNPVDSLTQEQIRGIYSGKITNWKEVGGNDEKIIPYQRNNDSGSQNYMVDFMKGYELMEPPKDYIVGAMGSLMDAVAVYDNSVQAIGYSVYSYAAQMYENSSDVKFIAVDGVAPSRETMADDSYPLLSSTYIVYTDNASQNTLDFVKWATSEEGQNCALENGYVPVIDIKYPDRLKPYKALGTGKERPADYKPSEMVSTSTYRKDYDGISYTIDFLKDKDFEKTINADLEAVLKDFDKGAYIEREAMNGYMSIKIRQSGMYGAYDKAAVLNYDLINSRRIEKFSDLFYKGMDFVPLVNDAAASFINGELGSCIKSDFIGITGTVDMFSIYELTLGDNNQYLSENHFIDYGAYQGSQNASYYLTDYMVTGEYFDLNKVFDNTRTHVSDVYYRDEWNVVIEKDNDGEIRQRVEGSVFHTPEEVEKRQKVYEIIFGKLKEIRADGGYEKSRILISEPYKTDQYDSLNVIYGDVGKVDGPHAYMFAPDTGEQLYFSDIFGSEFSYLDKNVYFISDIDTRNNTVVAHVYGGSGEKVIELDPDHVNMKYINIGMQKAKPQKLDTELKGEICWIGDSFYGYSSSYIVDYGPKEYQWFIEGDWHITAKNKIISHGDLWYECWDSDDGDYYGWIPDHRIDFYTKTSPFDVINNTYMHTSGVGGWATFLRLNYDGSFYGEYNDYNPGGKDEETGETIWNLDYYGFEGSFDNIQKINDLTYSGVIGKFETSSDMAPYHLGDRLFIIDLEDMMAEGDEILIYMKGTRVADMDEECRAAVGMPKAWGMNGAPEFLEENVIYNVTRGIAFFDEDGKVEFWKH